MPRQPEKSELVIDYEGVLPPLVRFFFLQEHKSQYKWRGECANKEMEAIVGDEYWSIKNLIIDGC